MKKYWLKIGLSLALIAGLNFQFVQAEQGPVHTLIPTGSDYRADTLERFAQAAVQRDTNGIVDLLVLPITYGTDALNTTNGERQKNLTLADGRRSQVEDACNVVKLPNQTCRVILAPVLIRSDAYLQSNLDLFNSDIVGMYILSRDQTISLKGVTNPRFE